MAGTPTSQRSSTTFRSTRRIPASTHNGVFAAVLRCGRQERRSSRSTSGCRTRWKARRRFRRLIHAATMVTAGVYLLARCAPLFARCPDAQIVVAWIGGGTALLAAFIALGQNDLKRSPRVLDRQPTGVHVPRAGHGRCDQPGVRGHGRDVPPVHACVLQGAVCSCRPVA